MRIRKPTGLVRLTRPYILLTTSLLFISSAFLSVGGIPPLQQFLKGFLAVSFAIAAAHAFNDYSDWELDIENPRTAKRPIPTGLVSPFEALLFSILLGTIAIVLAFSLGFLSILIVLAAIPLPFTYNYFRKHGIPFSFLCTLAAVLLIVLFGSVAVSSKLISSHVALFLAFGLSWETGRTLISEVQDVETDRALSVSTLSTILSSRRAARLVVILFAVTAGISLLIGLFAQLGATYPIIAFASGSWLVYKSIELLRAPTTGNATKMRINAPKYLVVICISMTISTIAKSIQGFV